MARSSSRHRFLVDTYPRDSQENLSRSSSDLARCFVDLQVSSQATRESGAESAFGIFELADAAIILRTRYAYTRNIHALTHTGVHARSRACRVPDELLSGRSIRTRVVRCSSQPGCYYRRTATTSSARPTSSTIAYIHRRRYIPRHLPWRRTHPRLFISVCRAVFAAALSFSP